MSRRKPNPQAVISVAEAERAIYIDCEGFEEQSPTLVGILIDGELEQVVLDPYLRAVADARGHRLSTLERETVNLQQRSTNESRVRADENLSMRQRPSVRLLVPCALRAAAASELCVRRSTECYGFVDDKGKAWRGLHAHNDLVLTSRKVCSTFLRKATRLRGGSCTHLGLDCHGPNISVQRYLAVGYQHGNHHRYFLDGVLDTEHAEP